MRIESFIVRTAVVRLAALICAGVLIPAAGMAQQPAPAPAPAPATEVAEDPKAPPPPPPLPPRSKDYPDPQGLTFGAFYWLAVPGQQPDIKTGKVAGQFEDLLQIGKPKQAPGVEISYPISRTGTLRAEGFQLKGAGSQTLLKDTAPLGLLYNKGDLLSTGYRIRGAKVYLDDLFWPHKYPIAKLRLKSILGVQFLQARANLDAPLKATNSSITTFTTNGTKQLYLPAIGVAVEYAVAPHVLFRVGGSGFFLPHKAYFYDGDASLAIRRKHVEVVVGYKALGFRTSPKPEYFLSDMISGGYGGLRWHW